MSSLIPPGEVPDLGTSTAAELEILGGRFDVLGLVGMQTRLLDKKPPKPLRDPAWDECLHAWAIIENQFRDSTLNRMPIVSFKLQKTRDALSPMTIERFWTCYRELNGFIWLMMHTRQTRLEILGFQHVHAAQLGPPDT